jgi:hypothetical protein
MMKKYLFLCMVSIMVLGFMGGSAAYSAVLYENDFNNPSDISPSVSWPDLVDMSTGQPVRAQNGRLEWTQTSNHWLRLDIQLPTAYIVEFDFFFQEGRKDRFSFWPLVGDTASQEKSGNGIFERFHYFLRDNTHYFNAADTIPTEGERDLTLPMGSPPHRLRAEVDGDHIALMFKNRGEGGWILIDERDFPAFGTGPRYVQFGMHGGDPVGLTYVDNLYVRGLSENRAIIARDIDADEFEANAEIPVSLQVEVKGSLSVLNITETPPPFWTVKNISNGGTFVNGSIEWNLSNIDAAMDLSYVTMPPRLSPNRWAYFSGSFESGDDAERIAGDTVLSIDLPYLFREAVDYDFSGSPQNGKKYPTGTDYGVRYAEGMDGVPSDVGYVRPTGDNTTPAIGATFSFPGNADFRQVNIDGRHGEGGYYFDGYRDDGESALETGASDTGTSIGSINGGDWFRFTFDFGEGDQVIILNFSVNTWGRSDCEVDVYLDNACMGTISAPVTSGNEFNFFTVGPTEITGGEHSIVIAFPPTPNTPTDLGRLEVVRVQGIGEVSRTLTADGFFEPTDALDVTLTSTALYGSYQPYIEETLPLGVEVVSISDGGQQVGNKLIWDLNATASSSTVSYTLNPPDGATFLLFQGFCDVGLPLARIIQGESSVMNEKWLFGDTIGQVKSDTFASSLSADWTVEYGNDPSLDTNYEEGVEVFVQDGALILGVDAFGEDAKFDEYANGRRAPMIVRRDIPDGDWRMESNVKLSEVLLQNQFATGLVVAYNEADDTDVSMDEYLFGYYQGEIQVEFTNIGNRGTLQYHNLADEFDWYDLVDSGGVSANFAVTRRANNLIFSVQLPGRPWQLVGAPVEENRQATRIGYYTKVWVSGNFVYTAFDNFTLAELDPFTAVENWELF